MGAYRETHEDMAREAETRASFYRTLASLYFKELDQAGIDALSNEDLTATGVDDETTCIAVFARLAWRWTRDCAPRKIT